MKIERCIRLHRLYNLRHGLYSHILVDDKSVSLCWSWWQLLNRYLCTMCIVIIFVGWFQWNHFCGLRAEFVLKVWNEYKIKLKYSFWDFTDFFFLQKKSYATLYYPTKGVKLRLIRKNTFCTYYCFRQHFLISSCLLLHLLPKYKKMSTHIKNVLTQSMVPLVRSLSNTGCLSAANCFVAE